MSAGTADHDGAPLAGSSLAGSSETAARFGARVAAPVEGRSLFFVIGRTDEPDAIVRSCGGRVLTHLPDRRRAIAIAPLAAHAELRRHPGLSLAGPISIDPERFGRFARMSGLDKPRPP